MHKFLAGTALVTCLGVAGCVGGYAEYGAVGYAGAPYHGATYDPYYGAQAHIYYHHGGRFVPYAPLYDPYYLRYGLPHPARTYFYFHGGRYVPFRSYHHVRRAFPRVYPRARIYRDAPRARTYRDAPRARTYRDAPRARTYRDAPRARSTPPVRRDRPHAASPPRAPQRDIHARPDRRDRRDRR
jgi:hypothetical protein